MFVWWSVSKHADRQLAGSGVVCKSNSGKGESICHLVRQGG